LGNGVRCGNCLFTSIAYEEFQWSNRVFEQRCTLMYFGLTGAGGRKHNFKEM
jgi:hypothetical protein